jgi:hypothetical protein
MLADADKQAGMKNDDHFNVHTEGYFLLLFWFFVPLFGFAALRCVLSNRQFMASLTISATTMCSSQLRASLIKTIVQFNQNAL